MDADINRVEFEATLDDFVDVNMRLVTTTTAYRQARWSYKWLFAVVVAGLLAVVMLRGNEVPSYSRIGLAAITALAGGLVFGIVGGRFYDSHVRSQYRRMLFEMYGGANAFRCQFELRDDTLWSRTVYSGVSEEVSFPWSRLTRVRELPDGIELWFTPGFAFVRDRAFDGRRQHREAFVSNVRKHLPAA